MLHQEIERKYLVSGDAYRSMATAVHHIVQGYLSTDPERTVRVRLLDDRACLTIKGRSDLGGLERMEWEQPINADDARRLLSICLPGVIDKTRYIVPWQGLTVEVDEFHGRHAGLVLAEIELPTADTPVTPPDFCTTEVTGNPRYYNAALAGG